MKPITIERPAKANSVPTITFDDLQNNPSGLVLLSQVAILFNRHTMTIRRWAKQDFFPNPVKICGVCYFKNADILAFKDSLPTA